VHNTVTVDGSEQMTRGGRFLTLDWFPAFSQSLLDSDPNIVGSILAYHKGYQRLGIRHEREVMAFVNDRWQVKDHMIFTQPGEHVFRLHWLLIDGEWDIENGEQRIGIRLKSPYGWIKLNVQPDSRMSLVRAGELLHGQREVKPYEGWVARTYGQKSPALSLAFEVTSSKSITFTSEFLFPK
jgi:hypothetical protein